MYNHKWVVFMHISITWLMTLVCFGVYRPTREFFTHMDTSPLLVKGCKCSALMAIEQWGFFSVPHLLRHGPTLYNDHPRGPVTHTFCRVFGSGAATIPVFMTGLSRRGIEPRSPAHKMNALLLRHRLQHCTLTKRIFLQTSCKINIIPIAQ